MVESKGGEQENGAECVENEGDEKNKKLSARFIAIDEGKEEGWSCIFVRQE